MRTAFVRLRRRIVFTLSESAKAHLRRYWHARQVEPVLVRPGLASARVVAAIVVKNGAARMPALLRHYRKLGVEHFIVVDNESSDSLVEDLRAQEDVTVYRGSGSYKAARYGNDWVNWLLSRHCHDKWVLYVDSDEFLVYDSIFPDLPSLCSWLDESGRRSLQAIMLDMYSENRPSANVLAFGQNPLEVCNLFDSTGYERRYADNSSTTWVKGGVRGRVFFSADRWEGPALNKTPLVHWKRHYAFLRAAHLAWPRGLNGGFRNPELAILHFKFTSASSALMADEAHRTEHTTEYLAYEDSGNVLLVGSETATYESPRDLTRYGVITRTGPAI